MKHSIQKPSLKLLFTSTCLVATSLTRLAQGGDFLFDNAGASTYPSDWSVPGNWNPDVMPNGSLDNAVFANVAGGMNQNPAALTNFQINNVPTAALNQLRFTSTPLNATVVNLQAAGAQTLTLNQIVVSGTVQNPATAGAAAANNGAWQIQPNITVSAAADPLYNPTGRLQVVNTTGSGLQLQGPIGTGPGGFVKDGSGMVRFGTTGATFTNTIDGDIAINNGTLQASNAGSGNVLGGSGRILLNGPGSVLNLHADYAASYGRDVVINANATIGADRSAATGSGVTLTLGRMVIRADDKYLSINSGNGYNQAWAGMVLGNNTINLRNGLNGNGRAFMGRLDGAGTINVSGAGGNSTQGFDFNTPSPSFTGRLNLFEGGNHLVNASEALGSANVVLGEASNTLPVSYPNLSIGSGGSPTVQSQPWSSLLRYDANKVTSGTITVNGASQINMGVVPTDADRIALRPYAVIQGSSAELAGFDVSGTGNLVLPSSNAVIGHETLGGADPANLPNTASHYFGLSAALNGPLTVGMNTPWKGVSNDRQPRAFGGGTTVLEVNGADNDPATVDVALAGLNQQVLTLLNLAGDKMVSANGQKFTIGIEGYGSTFNGLGSGAAPGGTVLLGRSAADNGLAANVDAIHVNSGNFQVNAAGALGGVPVEVNNGAGLDIAGTIGGALDGVINVNGGGTLVLNDPTLLTAPAINTITINSRGRLHITGATTPPNLLTASTQPITFAGAGHTVRVSIDNVVDLDAKVPDASAIWEIASTASGTTGHNNAANLWGTTFGANAGRLVIQTAGLTSDGGVFTNDNGGTRFLDAPLNIPGGITFAASTGTSLVLNNSAATTPVTVGGGSGAVRIGSLTPINGITKTHNPVSVQNNDGVYENTHNSSPQVIFTNGLKSGPVNLVTGSLAIDGPDSNTAILGDLTMGPGSRLYLGDGGNISTGNGFGGAAPRRGDLTPLLIAGSLTTGAVNVDTDCRIEMGIDATDPAVTGTAVSGRAQVQQAFKLAANADLMDTDRRNFWVNRSAGSAVLGVDLNRITLGTDAALTIQESNTDVRAAIAMSGNATVAGYAGGAGCFDLKSVSGSGTLKIGRPDMPFSAVGLYGAIDAGVAVSSEYGRFEVRDGASIPAGFTFTDNAVNARAVQSVQNAAPAGINAGSDHTLSIWKGQTGSASTSLSGGTFLMNTANNAAGLYVDDVATGTPIVNVIQTGITLGAPGTVLFSARGNTDAAVNGTARIREVNVAAPHVLLATRDMADLEVSTLKVSNPAVVKVAGARANGRGAVRIGDVVAATHDVHFQDGRTTITGNVASGRLTAGGTSLEIHPGAAATATIAASAVQVNSMLALKSGTVDFGSAVLASHPAGTLVGGLLEGVILGNAGDMDTANPALNPATANLYHNENAGIRLDPRVGSNNYSDDNATVTNDTARGWSRNQTWVYTGEIYDADGIFTLAENIDDNAQIKIDGVIVQASNGVLVGGTGLALQAPFNTWATATNTSTRDGLTTNFIQSVTGAGDIGNGLADTIGVNLNPSGGITNFGMGPANDGWHRIEIRMGNGSGGAGPVVGNGWANYFGFGLNKDGTTSLQGTDYTKPVDNGSMNLFRTATVAKGNIDVDNGAAVSAGQVANIGLLTFGRNGASGPSSLSLSSTTPGNVDLLEVAPTTAGIVSLNLVNAAGKLTAARANVAEGKTLDLNPGGAGELEITQGSALTGNPAALVQLKGGKLRLSNPGGSALAEAILTLDAGTLTGSGATSGTVTAMTGSTVAPGTGAGLLTLGDTTLQDGSTLEWEVSDWTGAAGAGYDTLNTAALHFTPGAGTVTLKVREAALTNFSNVTKTFTLATATGAVTDFTPAKVVLDTTGFTAGAGVWSVAQSGSSLLLTYTASAATPYDIWAASFALGAGSPKDADPDGDGKMNILEFALNSNPTTGVGSGEDKTNGSVATLSGDPAATFTLPVRLGAVFSGGTELVAVQDGARYRIQASTDLTDWALDVEEVTPALGSGMPALDTGWEYRTFRIPGAVSAETRVFFRAVIEPVP